MKNPLDLIQKIVSKTIGFDLVETKPMSDNELKKWNEEREQARKEWEDSHPEQVAAIKAWEKKYHSKKPYTLSYDEREIVKELLNIDDDYLDMMDIYIFDDGDICVRTPQFTWTSLCGREWSVNLKEKKSTLTCMN